MAGCHHWHDQEAVYQLAAALEELAEALSTRHQTAAKHEPAVAEETPIPSPEESEARGRFPSELTHENHAERLDAIEDMLAAFARLIQSPYGSITAEHFREVTAEAAEPLMHEVILARAIQPWPTSSATRARL